MSARTPAANTTVSVWPKPAGAAITVANVTGLPTGAVSGDAVERDADGAFWDTTNNVYVRPDQCSFGGIVNPNPSFNGSEY